MIGKVMIYRNKYIAMSKRNIFIVLGSTILIVGALVVLAGKVPLFRVNAFSNDNEVHGYAWSTNVGWLSFNCADRGVCATSNYKTAIDLATGQVLSAGPTHYAWSSNIGWVDTNPTSGYPGAPNHGLRFDINSGTVTGWVRALSYGNGWDGWIKITDAKVGAGGIVRNAANTAGGWAWGSDVVGWVQFSDSFIVPHADCDFGADPTTITPPQKSTLSWGCNALTAIDSCAIDNGVGVDMPITGTRLVAPPRGTMYTLTCQGFGGPVVKTAAVYLTGESTTVPGEAASGTIRIREVLP
ncbi:hypothetical protein A2524_03075 [Candidatus Wolfebacteria bacterium RIFOXYD12_FULL_48_21]|uniref:Uncharacterized protein n=1 Tax=Candidatus Wolfebacteria bacterium RIFOXYD1_FULL_48_65 TaxID=1802561 RepID=A0A1F8E3Q7_9BACT|nr:MAG: hypothetical protein A2610_02080 [Candidatus Wolfebacteria bacterium RIFOXYD1_FULL_48_65]OGM95046.1 MAG: hypothetical protein A2524_03075 [Candidatus Wolfebacteria bacterium RIFOXYD12_FULL_48_21]OGM96093.1 MAG: hypothetical protein A2532_01630 [Candidatus Wolfebacteria bacterium RIFOXYD2_FULL_48_11]